MLKHFIVIEKSTNQIIKEHFADEKGRYEEFSDENRWHEMEVPLEAVISYLKVDFVKGKYVLIEDIQKKKEYMLQLFQEKLDAVRNQRNLLLKESDWTQGADSPLSDTQKLAWKTYRQKLRDITKTISVSQQNVTWPTLPK